MERVLAALQGHLAGLAGPVDQQAHRRPVVGLVQERLDHQRERLGGAEMLQVFAPEGQVGAGLAALVPARERRGHLGGRRHRLAAVDRPHLADAGRGEPVPPGGQALHGGGARLDQCRLAAGRRLAQHPGVQREQPLDRADQVVDALVAHGVLARREDREQPLEAQHVPRVGQGPALDAAQQQFLDLRQQFGGRRQLPALHQQRAAGQPAVNLAHHPRRRRGDARRLLPRRLGVTHVGEQQR